jgi:hypothetical protein
MVAALQVTRLEVVTYIILDLIIRFFDLQLQLPILKLCNDNVQPRHSTLITKEATIEQQIPGIVMAYNWSECLSKALQKYVLLCSSLMASANINKKIRQ